MRTYAALIILACCLTAEAHIGSPNVFLEDKAGAFPVRVVIRPPQVVPGLAEITVRVTEPVQRITVLPVFWKVSRKDAPPADEARLVRGETNLYSAQLWLMSPGAYSVDVTVEGARGTGTLAVPVNAMATNTRPMSQGYGLMLAVLGVVLFIGGLTIARAIFTESHLAPGTLPAACDRCRGRIAMAATAVALALLAYGGKKWWDAEDHNYRNNSLYKPLAVEAQVRSDHDQLIMALKVDTSARRGRWTPLIPDHGKLMHLFLVQDGPAGAFAHLHPVSRGAAQFEVPLPPLPAGPYHLYADVTHEDGFAETLVATAEIPASSFAMKNLWLAKSGEAICSIAVAQMLATNLYFPPDLDDSWHMSRGTTTSKSAESTRLVTDAGGGYKIAWENPGDKANNLDASLRFKLLTPDGRIAWVEPYMGMAGHAVVRRQDGAVFSHIHPVGTFSMAAQKFLLAEKPPKNSGSTAPTRSAPEVHSNHTNQVSTIGEVFFPYAFPEPGTYRLWVQMKSEGRILTGAFDTTIASTK